MGSGASAAAYLGIGMDDTITSLGSSMETEIWSDVSTKVPASDWSVLEIPVTPKQGRRIQVLNLQISQAQLAWLRSVS